MLAWLVGTYGTVRFSRRVLTVGCGPRVTVGWDLPLLEYLYEWHCNHSSYSPSPGRAPC